MYQRFRPFHQSLERHLLNSFYCDALSVFQFCGSCLTDSISPAFHAFTFFINAYQSTLHRTVHCTPRRKERPNASDHKLLLVLLWKPNKSHDRLIYSGHRLTAIAVLSQRTVTYILIFAFDAETFFCLLILQRYGFLRHIVCLHNGDVVRQNISKLILLLVVRARRHNCKSSAESWRTISLDAGRHRGWSTEVYCFPAGMGSFLTLKFLAGRVSRWRPFRVLQSICVYQTQRPTKEEPFVLLKAVSVI